MNNAGPTEGVMMQLASLAPAIFGLVGVVVGAVMTFARDLWFQRQRDLKERQYLAIQVSSLLERYVSGCVEVVADNGLYHGQPDENGIYQAQAEEPKFEPELLQVDWKSLPPNLMYEILDFPLLIADVQSFLADVGDMSAPPDYEEWFEERQYQYAYLGLQAASLSERLRNRIGLPSRPRPVTEWDPLQFMAKRRDEIDALRAKMAAMPSPFGSGMVDTAPKVN